VTISQHFYHYKLPNLINAINIAMFKNYDLNIKLEPCYNIGVTERKATAIKVAISIFIFE